MSNISKLITSPEGHPTLLGQ